MEQYEELLNAVQAGDGGREIRDVATGEVIGRAPVEGVEDLEAAIARATAAQPAWAALGHEERSRLLHAAADAVEAHGEALARLLSREQGKPLDGPNARFEVGACSAWLRAAADTVLEPQVLVDDESGRAELHYRALGLVAAIGPWNWPLMIAVWQFAPALRMGNAVIVKPSEYTPLSVLALVHVVNSVLPAGVLEAISGDREVSAALAEHPAISKVMFTGSTKTGSSIIRSSADTIKRLTLELGGNDAGIVLDDVDPAAIAEDLFWGAFINTGQTCAALKRLYVHSSVHDAVVRELAAVAARTPMGPGLEEGNLLGPVQNEAQFRIVQRLVDSAKAAGATLATGGTPLGGTFFPITIVTDIADDADLVQEEQFGPALPVIRFDDVEDAIAMANAASVGLGASVWSSDRDRALELASRLQAGTVWVNSHGGLHPMVPFGGVKQSGYGLEFGVEGLKAVAASQVIRS
ncbi:acyl-CoA reductase-like NAD-dependent aldehyde dehydrogenase [Arthrobacter woluwensis]|uniref:aldehyde dehydrogenase family protein n=1 Tax=Arthrobacter woluwensis TaxID=156980 RepID=UPI0027801C25|nr:aldehyde dehydrogenase family protein [Arthrobacter woluwensis]MDQ0708933.1 acyl-CoA reductase-like NAD-dependent aldehyde dehydrogenase [Arthrobacter woluwensis]